MKVDLCAKDTKFMPYLRIYVLCTEFPSLVVTISIKEIVTIFILTFFF